MSISDRRLEAFRQQLESEIKSLEDSTEYVIEEINLRKQSVRTLGQPRENWETEVEIVVRRHNTDERSMTKTDPVDTSQQVIEAFVDILADRVRSRL